MHKDWTMGVENNVAGRLKLDVFLECVYFLKAKDNDFWHFVLLEIFTEKVIKGCMLYIIIIRRMYIYQGLINAPSADIIYIY